MIPVVLLKHFGFVLTLYKLRVVLTLPRINQYLHVRGEEEEGTSGEVNHLRHKSQRWALDYQTCAGIGRGRAGTLFHVTVQEPDLRT